MPIALNSSFPEVLNIVLFSWLPIVEIRGAIPLALSYGFDNLQAFIISYLGSVLAIPFAFVLWYIIFKFGMQLTIIRKLVDRLSIRTLRKSTTVKKYNWIGLTLFVAIPFPGTGIWSGVLLVNLMKMDFKKSLIAISTGNFIAGILVLMASNGVKLLF